MLKTIDSKIEALKDLYYALEQVEAKWGCEGHDTRMDIFYTMCGYYNIPVSVMAEELELHINEAEPYLRFKGKNLVKVS